MSYYYNRPSDESKFYFTKNITTSLSLHGSMTPCWPSAAKVEGSIPSHGSPFIKAKGDDLVITKWIKDEATNCLDGLEVRGSTSVPKVAGSILLNHFTFLLII